MNLLLIGSGGREHALAWSLSASSLLSKLYCAPGNAGICDIATCVGLDICDHQSIIDFCRRSDVDLVVVGPEAPLVAGLVDDLTEAGIKAFGPTRAAAALEGSKGFTRDLCREFDIPGPAYLRTSRARAAKDFVRSGALPVVIKADGLAAGKGVTIAETLADADAAIEQCLAGAFGDAGASLVIEEFLQGEEASFFALVDGRTALPLETAQDHKRLGEGDSGPNTGGMGAYSPAPVLTDALKQRVMDEIINPTISAMAARGTPYKGVLYAGLMITPSGPKLIEYNVRFGDPECQVLMMRLRSDLLPALLATCDGALEHFDLRWRDEAALTVVMASEGYPGAYEKNTPIGGLDEAGADENVEIFHAGTARCDGRLVAVGGRVLNVTALGRDVGRARARAYAAVGKIDWPQGIFRRDIAWRAIAPEQDG